MAVENRFRFTGVERVRFAVEERELSELHAAADTYWVELLQTQVRISSIGRSRQRCRPTIPRPNCGRCSMAW